jgi:hypothetical protein
MIDAGLFRKLLAECSPETHIILVGDVDQLGPIAPVRPFADLIESGVIPVTKLDRVFRFVEGGAIAAAAKAINTGDVSTIMAILMDRNLNSSRVMTYGSSAGGVEALSARARDAPMEKAIRQTYEIRTHKRSFDG